MKLLARTSFRIHTNADIRVILHSALVVQWIGHNFAEVKMMVRFHPRAPVESRLFRRTPA